MRSDWKKGGRSNLIIPWPSPQTRHGTTFDNLKYSSSPCTTFTPMKHANRCQQGHPSWQSDHNHFCISLPQFKSQLPPSAVLALNQHRKHGAHLSSNDHYLSLTFPHHARLLLSHLSRSRSRPNTGIYNRRSYGLGTLSPSSLATENLKLTRALE
jgi:hypothetical protein